MRQRPRPTGPDANTTNQLRQILPRAKYIRVDQSSVMGHTVIKKSRRSKWAACSDCGEVGNGHLIDHETGKCRGRIACAKRKSENRR